jgi:putative hemolysin
MLKEPNINLGVEQVLQAETTKMPSALKTICRPLARWLDTFLRWSKFNRFTAKLDLSLDFKGFMQACMKEFNLSIVDVDGLMEKIPQKGPVIFVSNHPTGFVETVGLPNLIMRVRPELKVLANEMLSSVHWVAPQIIPLNVFNATGVKRVLTTAEAWLNQEGALLIFPSGEVADYKKEHGRITDGEWSRLPLMLAEKTKAKIIHINLAAETTVWFKMVSRLCRPARVLWLMKEFYRQGGRDISCYSSAVSLLSSLPAQPKPKLIKFLHALNDCLPIAKYYQKQAQKSVRKEIQIQEPLAKQVELSLVEEELQNFPEEATVYTHKAILVYVAVGKDMPITLKYIQIERERVFRDVDMGTGKSMDGDYNDEEAFHVVVWDTRKKAMIASTRCDIICKARPKTYLNELYQIEVDKLLEMGDMMEVSRTFVLLDYQRSFSSLLCLWRGLSLTVLRHKRVRFVAGVVSIAGNKMQEILFDCLATYVGMVAEKNRELSQLFSPRFPYVLKNSVSPEVKHCLSLVSSVEELEHLFKELTKGEGKLPMLFRQYESLGTVPMAISVDEEFASCVDVLQVWDTHDTRSAKLRLFFGDDGIDELRERARK